MSVSGATLSPPAETPILYQTNPKFPYECVDGGFYYTVAHSARGREFVSLPGLTATQVQELIEKEGISFFPPENFDGNESFAFTHGWPIGSNKVGIVAEDGVLSCTIYDETGAIILDEVIPQHDCDGNLLPAGEIYCRFSRLTPFIDPDGKICIFCSSRLDSKITVDEAHWAVTLVNSKAPTPKWPFGHAVLLIEKIEDGQYKMMKAHFTGVSRGGTDCERKIDAMVGTSPGRVEYYEVNPSYHYHSKTETWSLPRCNVEQMINEIRNEIGREDPEESTDNPVFFRGPGHGTIFTSKLLQTPDVPRVENCLTWTIKKLLSAGAELYHLPEGILMNRPAEYISSYERSRNRAIGIHRIKEMVIRNFHNDHRIINPLQGVRSLENRFSRFILGSSFTFLFGLISPVIVVEGLFIKYLLGKKLPEWVGKKSSKELG